MFINQWPLKLILLSTSRRLVRNVGEGDECQGSATNYLGKTLMLNENADEGDSAKGMALAKNIEQKIKCFNSKFDMT